MAGLTDGHSQVFLVLLQEMGYFCMRKGTVTDAGERTDLRGEEGGRGRAGSVRERDWVGCCLGWDRGER